MDKSILQQIRFKDPKYMLPALIYIPLLAVGYVVIDTFNIDLDHADDGLETTEYLNSKIPEANIKGDGVPGKYESMLDSWGNIKDETAVEEAGEDTVATEAYESKYTDAERARMEAEAAKNDGDQKEMAQLRRQLASAERRQTGGGSNSASEDATLRELQRSLEAARKASVADTKTALATGAASGSAMAAASAPASASPSVASQPGLPSTTSVSGNVEVKETVTNPKAVKEIAENAEPEEVVKKQTTQSAYFNTIAKNEKEKKLIKAIIDEDIKAVDNSRVRLRLLDELEIGDRTVPKGTYLYAIMSGFGGQRVKGTVSSLMLDEDLVKINLSIYDTDGLEGLYVPASDFRELSKDVGSGVFSSGGTSMFSGGISGSNIAQMGMQALQNGYSKVTSAISKAIKKNRAHLKYGTVVYLVNSKEKKKKNDDDRRPSDNNNYNY